MHQEATEIIVAALGNSGAAKQLIASLEQYT